MPVFELRNDFINLAPEICEQLGRGILAPTASAAADTAHSIHAQTFCKRRLAVWVSRFTYYSRMVALSSSGGPAPRGAEAAEGRAEAGPESQTGWTRFAAIGDLGRVADSDQG